MSLHYCEADKDYWRDLKKQFANKPPSVCYKRTTSIFDDEMWIIEGRGTSRSILHNSMIWYCPGQNRFNTSHSRCKGFRALDICSSWGISSRVFLEGHHSVDVIEPEGFMASLVECNSRKWKMSDRIHVVCRNDLHNIQFNGYDSVRLGTHKLAYILMDNPEIYNVKNIVLDFSLNEQIKHSILDRGYVMATNYSASTLSFTRA